MLCLSMYELVVYDDELLNNLIDVFSSYKLFKKVVIYYHDKDLDSNGDLKKAHYHCYMHLGKAYELDYISKLLNVEMNYFERIKGRWNNALEYGFHFGQIDKHLYDLDCVKFVKNVDIKSFFNKYGRDELFDKCLNDLANGLISIRELYNLFTADEIMPKLLKVDKALKVASMSNLDTNKPIKVYSIFGGSGSGKTTLAKYLCTQKGLTYYVTSSGANLFDDYQGEDCVIIDDFRANQMTFSDLLKLLDNNTRSMIKARYRNVKPRFSYIIITSIKSPLEYYSSDLLTDEPLIQLLRRISKVLTIVNGKAYQCINLGGRYVYNETKPLFDLDSVIAHFKSEEIKLDELF